MRMLVVRVHHTPVCGGFGGDGFGRGVVLIVEECYTSLLANTTTRIVLWVVQEIVCWWLLGGI